MQKGGVSENSGYLLQDGHCNFKKNEEEITEKIVGQKLPNSPAKMGRILTQKGKCRTRPVVRKKVIAFPICQQDPDSALCHP